VTEEDSAYSAFKLMLEKSYSALAVVDKYGTLVGNISINDLKVTHPAQKLIFSLKLIGYNTSYWNALGKSVGEYLKQVRSTPEAKLRSSTLTLLQKDDSAYPIVVKACPYHSFGWVLR
jgi:CBS-domain-containing membrane protein